MRVVDGRGGEFYAGGPTGFLLAHGLTSSPTEMRFLAQSLAKAGFTVSVPMLAAHGNGRAELESSRWQDWRDGLIGDLQSLRRRCDRIVVGGASAGAVVALQAAMAQPSLVHGLALYAPALWPDGWAIPRPLRFFRLVNHRWFARLFHFRDTEPFGIKDQRLRSIVLAQLAHAEEPGQIIGGYPGTALMELRKMVAQTLPAIAAIKQPTLVFHPRDDDMSDLSGAQRIVRALGGPTEMIVLENSYHLVALDQQRQLVADRSTAFGIEIDQSQREARRRGAHLVVRNS